MEKNTVAPLGGGGNQSLTSTQVTGKALASQKTYANSCK